jgi:ATP-binding cassette subfamily F protein 3
VPEVKQQDILNMAGAFLFRGDDVKKKVSVLSGGERARLVLAGLLLTKSQVLLLDEPTNHLDFETVEALGTALKTFAGTIFFISHDRTFVNLIATNILEIKNGRVLKYPGKYEDYVYHLEQVARGEEEETDEAEALDHDHADMKTEASQSKKPESSKPDPEIKKLQTQIVKSDNRIKQLNKEKAELVKEIENNPFHYSRERNARIKELTVSIEEEEKRWLDLSAKLEKLKTSS